MTHHESSPAEIPQDNYDHLAFEALSAAIDLLPGGEKNTERDDLWSITWQELHEPTHHYIDTDEQIDRQTATTQIHSLYMSAMQDLYPDLRTAESAEDMMMQLALIPDLPPCNGSFVRSEYESEYGEERAMTFTEVILDDETVMMSARFIFERDNVVRQFEIVRHLNRNLWIGCGTIIDRDPAENDMLYAVHPTQFTNLQNILNGTIELYELDMKLTEIRVMSETVVDEEELERILAYARQQYFTAVAENNASANKNKEHDMIAELQELTAVIDERYRQLE